MLIPRRPDRSGALTVSQADLLQTYSLPEPTTDSPQLMGQIPSRRRPQQVQHRPQHSQTYDPTLISPLSITSGTFERLQAEFMGRTTNGASTTIHGTTRSGPPRTRRRSAIYYRHGRTVADTTIEVFEDVESLTRQASRHRKRTSTLGTGSSTKSCLIDITNQSRVSIMEPSAYTGKQHESSSEDTYDNPLGDLPAALSSLAWLNNNMCAMTAEHGDAFDMLGTLRDGLRSDAAAQRPLGPSAQHSRQVSGGSNRALTHDTSNESGEDHDL